MIRAFVIVIAADFQTMRSPSEGSYITPFKIILDKCIRPPACLNRLDPASSNSDARNFRVVHYRIPERSSERESGLIDEGRGESMRPVHIKVHAVGWLDRVEVGVYERRGEEDLIQCR